MLVFLTHGTPINTIFRQTRRYESIHNLKINTTYMYDTPFDRSFFQLSNDIRHVMPSTDRKPELKARHQGLRPPHRRLCINQPSEFSRLTGGFVGQRVNAIKRLFSNLCISHSND
jgi:hypothetical protein